jgi:hypothetical protein
MMRNRLTHDDRRESNTPLMISMYLPSGLVIENPAERLDAFLTDEWPYYDGIADEHPNQIVPIDVLAPVSVNAYAFRGGAANLRRIHVGLAAACDSLLPEVPVEADLRSVSDLTSIRTLLHEAIQVPYVLLPVATRVLFRKRRALIPMLDNILLAYYIEALGHPELLGRSQIKSRAAEVGMTVLDSFVKDLVANYDALDELADHCSADGRPVGPVRILELLVWCQVEPRGYYRATDNTPV